jgi:hypothetical protein
MTELSIDHFLEGDGVDTEREKIIGQHIGYRYDVNLVPDNQQDRDMIARELRVKFQMAKGHPLVDLRKAYEKFA